MGGSYTFDKPIYISLIGLSLALILQSWIAFRDAETISIKDPIVWIWLIPVTFIISAINGVSTYSSIYSIYIHVFYVIFFGAGCLIAKSKNTLNVLEQTLIISGYIVVLHGFLNWFGFVQYKDAIFGYRLAGAFQYPNAYAAFLIGFLFISITQILRSRSWKIYVLHSLMLVPIMLSIIFTLSRGGLILLIVSFFLYISIMNWRKQLISILIIATTVVVSIMVSSIIYNARAPSVNEEIVGGSLLILASGIVTFMIWVLKEKLVKLNEFMDRCKGSNRLVLPVSMLFIVGLLGFIIIQLDRVFSILPSLLQRLTAFDLGQAAFSDRFSFLKDALTMINQKPIFGYGGGGWSAVYEKYRSFPYTSNQAHDFIVQYIIEVGFLGGIVLLVLIGWIFFNYLMMHIKEDWSESESFTFVLVAGVLLMHSLVDFTLSFVYLASIVFLALGVMWGSVRISRNKTKEITNSKRNYRIVKSVFLSIVSIVAVILFVSSICLLQANDKFAYAIENIYKKNQIVPELNEAVKMQPLNPEYALFEINIKRQLYGQTKDQKLLSEIKSSIQKLEKTEPYNKHLYREHYSFLVQIGEYKEALKLIRNKENDFPWNAEQYEIYLSLLWQVGNNSSNEEEYWKEAHQLYEKIQDKEAFANKNNIQVDHFEINKAMKLTMGRILFSEGEYKQVSDMLGVLIQQSFDIPINVELSRLFIASTMLQDRLSEFRELYMNLITEVPQEKDNIERLVAEGKND
ncbi:O-antigen ligase family protein [Cohnella phaseoli]|uniref:O-antigen ligase n=1 Tax=Cohnella phaseoli TaxID=456490 RepID=A0A3D9KBY7_9BACL|nr:O-antigen ligase family protein [Cohnella phaseoli]RED84041.1 O-antigen ligase [Cohnella phaseoli]